MVFLFVCLIPAEVLQAQQYDLLLKGGHLIDPKNEIDALMDVAVKNGRIAQISANISEATADQVVDVSGLYVTPGILDIHSLNYWGTDPNRTYSNGFWPLPPDMFSFRSGVTTVVDAGGAGWRNFEHFKEQVIDRSRTRVLSHINIVGDGLTGGIAQQNVDDMSPRMAALMAKRHPEHIVGVMIAGFTGPQWRTTIKRAVEAGDLADIPVMVSFGGGRRSIEELYMELLRPGDIFSFVYQPGPAMEPVVDESGQVKPFVFDAQERGIIFDVAHGASSFVYSQAIPAIEQGLLPNTISADNHVGYGGNGVRGGAMNGAVKNMDNVMSKFLSMGLSLQEVILRTTWNSAMAIKRMDLGHLSEGAVADIAVFNLKSGNFGFVDAQGWRLEGTQKLEAELTILGGQIEWDLNGISAPAWDSYRGERPRMQ